MPIWVWGGGRGKGKGGEGQGRRGAGQLGTDYQKIWYHSFDALCLVANFIHTFFRVAGIWILHDLSCAKMILSL